MGKRKEEARRAGGGKGPGSIRASKRARERVKKLSNLSQAPKTAYLTFSFTLSYYWSFNRPDFYASLTRPHVLQGKTRRFSSRMIKMLVTRFI